MAKEIRYELNINDYSYTHGEVYAILKNILHLSDHEISQCKFDGEILVNGEKAYVNSRMRVSDILLVRFPEDKVEEIVKIDDVPDILYETDDFVAVNKPSGIPTHASHNHLDDSTGSILISYYQKQGVPFVARSIGRLDNEVSGVVLFAKNQPAASRLNQERITGKLKKIYIAYAEGIFKEKEGMISLPLAKIDEGKERKVDTDNGQEAITQYKVMEEREINGFPFSVVAVTIITGRTHQIRAHMKAIGHPLLGDSLYGGNTEYIKRVSLHAAKMEFLSPFTHETVKISSPLPEDLKDVILHSQKCIQKAEPDEETKELTKEIIEPVAETKTIPLEEAAVIMPEKHKKGHTFMIIVLVLLLLGILGTGIYYFVTHFYTPMPIKETPVVEVKSDEELYNSLTISFNDKDSVLVNESIDPMAFVESYEGDISILQSIDTSVLGKQHIVYKLTVKNNDGKNVTRVFIKEITVKSDKVGAIFEAESVAIKAGNEFDPKGNISGIYDAYGNELSFSEELLPGTYIIEHNVDVQKEGTYNVVIKMMDQDGAISKASYEVIVKGKVGSINPLIWIRKDEIKIAKGTVYDIKNNVISVTDAIDGTIPYADTEQNGRYTIVSDLNVNEPGVYNVQLTALDKEGNRTTDEWTITVEAKPETDTTPPQIWIYQDYFTITAGANYRLTMNVMSVTDDVDGTLPWSDVEAPGTYTIVSNFDINTPGEYDVQLIAIDKAGNRSTDEWVVNVVSPAGENTGGDSTSNSDQIYNYLTGNMGLNRAAAIGIMANIKRESSYRPDVYNGSSNYGLCQWGGSRYRRLMEFCNNNGLDYRTVDGQVHYIEYELNNFYTGVLSQLQSVEDSKDGAYNAGYIFAEQYEGAGPGYPEQAGESAKSMY